MSDDIIKLLNELLLREYLQRDVYETYSYYLFGLCSPALKEHLEEHQKEETEHAKVLQRYLMELRAEPLHNRLEIPAIQPPIENILAKNLELEKDAVKRYTDAIKYLEKLPDDSSFTALKVDLENILVQEQEHVHDIMQWTR